MDWRRAVLAVLILICACKERESVHPFPNATEVRLFVETDYRDGKPVYTNSVGLILNPDQRSRFEAMIHIHKAPDEQAACFVPHHFFRYYNRLGKQVGEVAVCFCCEGVGVEGDAGFFVLPGQEITADYDLLRDFVSSLGEPTNVQC